MSLYQKTISVSKEIHVDIEISLDDVRSYIREADKSDLNEIAKALSEHDVHAHLTKLNSPTIQYLVNRANQFGLEDMLDELRREGERVGVYLNQGVKP